MFGEGSNSLLPNLFYLIHLINLFNQCQIPTWNTVLEFRDTGEENILTTIIKFDFFVW